MIKIAITGSICTGKSSVLKIFEELGIPTFNCDVEVKKIYKDTQVVQQIKSICPSSVSGVHVDLKTLGNLAFKQKQLMNKLEQIIHPRLFEVHEKFLEQNRARKVVALEIPILFEKNLEKNYDVVILTMVDRSTQEQRAASRGINIEKLNLILDLQLPDHVKASKANYILDTSLGHDKLVVQVKTIIGRSDG